jgi:hypothetical protein
VQLTSRVRGSAPSSEVGYVGDESISNRTAGMSEPALRQVSRCLWSSTFWASGVEHRGDRSCIVKSM